MPRSRVANLKWFNQCALSLAGLNFLERNRVGMVEEDPRAEGENRPTKEHISG